MNTPTSRATVGPALAAATALFTVGTSTATAATLNAYPVFGGQALRYALAALVLAAIVRVQRPARVRLGPRDVAWICALAAVGLVGFSVCQVCATRYAQASTVGMVIAATPVVLALAGPLMARRRPSARVVLGAVVVAVGAAAASGLGHGSPAGFALSVGALACEVGFSLLAVPLLPRLGAVRVAMYAALAAAPLSLLAGVATAGRGALRMPTAAEAGGLAYLGVVVGAGSFMLWYSALPRLGPERAGLFYGFVPIGTVATTVALGIGVPGPADLIGGAVVIAGLVAGLWPASTAPRRRAATRVARRDRDPGADMCADRAGAGRDTALRGGARRRVAARFRR